MISVCFSIYACIHVSNHLSIRGFINASIHACMLLFIPLCSNQFMHASFMHPLILHACIIYASTHPPCTHHLCIHSSSMHASIYSNIHPCIDGSPTHRNCWGWTPWCCSCWQGLKRWKLDTWGRLHTCRNTIPYRFCGSAFEQNAERLFTKALVELDQRWQSICWNIIPQKENNILLKVAKKYNLKFIAYLE